MSSWQNSPKKYPPFLWHFPELHWSLGGMVDSGAAHQRTCGFVTPVVGKPQMMRNVEDKKDDIWSLTFIYIYNYIIYVYTYIHILRWHTFYPDLKQNTFVFSVEVWRSPVAIGSKKIKNGAEDNSARSPPRRCRGECRWRMETARACRACRIRMRKSRTVNKMRIFQWKRWAEKRGGIINE